MEFKVGDSVIGVRVVNNLDCKNKVGKIVEISWSEPRLKVVFTEAIDNPIYISNGGWWVNEGDLKHAVTPEPQKSFRRAEITDGDNLLTQDGQRIFLTWLLGKYADEFKTAVVDGLLKKEDK